MRRATTSFLGLAGLMLALAPGHADEYPSRHITLIAPWPAAGAIDTLCRELAPGVGDRLGQPVIVENRPGAGSTIGTADGAKAAPDGYTLVMAGIGSLAISPALYKELPYDPKRDFVPIALVAKVPFVLVVNPSLPVQSVADLIKYAKEHPGTLTYGSGGAGSPHQLFAEMFKTMTGIEMTHVPYKGTAPALTDVIGGHISLMFADASLGESREGASARRHFDDATAGRARYSAACGGRRAGIRCRRLGHGGSAGTHSCSDCEQTLRGLPHGRSTKGRQGSDDPSRHGAAGEPATGKAAELH